MPHGQFSSVLNHLRGLLRPRRDGDWTDGQLLRRFADERSEDAFGELMRRHGPLVYSACRRVLGDGPDAEDTYQAAFLVLVRKARSLEGSGSVANWLYKVAYRLALNARTAQVRRQAHERKAVAVPTESTSDASDLRPLLDEELNRLPAHYREPLVLCYLQGKTNEEAARDLGCPLSTLKMRLLRGREALRGRLARRGLALAEAALVAALTPYASAAVPAPLAETALRAAMQFALGSTQGIAPGSLTLTKGMLKTMVISKLKIAAAVLLVLGIAGAGTGAWLHSAGEAVAPAERAAPPGDAAAEPPPALPEEPLPPGAVARIPFARFRHATQIGRMAFAPDGKTLASTSVDNTIRVWDAATGTELRRILLNAPVPEDNGAKAFEPQRVEGHHLGGGVAYAPDSKHLAVSRGEKCVRLYHLESGKFVRKFQRDPAGDSGFQPALTFSPDGQLLVAAGMGTVSVWDVATGKERFILGQAADDPNGKGRLGLIHLLQFSPDGKQLALASNYGFIKLFDIATGKETDSFVIMAGVSHLAFSADGKSLAGVDENRIYCIWELATRKERLRTRFLDDKVMFLAMGPDINTIVGTPAAGGLGLYDAASHKRLRQLEGGAAHTGPTVYSPDGRTLAQGGYDGRIRLWEVATGKERTPRDGSTGLLCGVALSPDGSMAVTASDTDPHVHLWDLGSRRLLRTLKGHTIGVNAVAFAPDGKTLATAGADNTARLWDTATGREIRLFPGAEAGVAGADARLMVKAAMRSVTFTPDGQSLISLSDSWEMLIPSGLTDNRVHRDPILLAAHYSVWNVATGKERHRLKWNAAGKTKGSYGPGLTFVPPAISPKGTRMVSNQAGILFLWDLTTGKEIKNWLAPDERFVALALNDEGDTLTTLSRNGQIKVWDVAAGTSKQVGAAVDDIGVSAAFGPGGHSLVEVRRTGDIRLRDAVTGKELHTWPSQGELVGRLAISADGKRLVSGTATMLLLWKMPDPAKP